MFQSNTNKFFKLALLTLVVFSTFSSCSKKPSGVRAQVKSQKSDLNPAVSSQAEAQAAALNANYKISTVSIPTQTASGYTVDVELLTPDGMSLPLTTRHENGALDSQGIYTDSARNLQVYVQARCSSDQCFKYLLMVTAVRSNQMVFQSVALSYKDDCKFHSISSSANIGSFYSSLDTAEAQVTPQASPKNDCSE